MNSTQKRILLDLAKEYRDKIRRGAAHMSELCELEDISTEDIISTILSTNMHFVVETIDRTTDMSAEDFGITCTESLQQHRASKRRRATS